jgi:hypothetical protein
MKPREAKPSSADRDEENGSEGNPSFSAEPEPADLSQDELRISDNFVIGTAAVDPWTQNADVCFRAVSGVDQTAREITRFQGETFARGEISYWHVFYRVSSKDDPQQFVALVQRKYDETVAYRNQLMQLYNARTIRRC